MASRRNLKKKITNIASDLFLVSLMEGVNREVVCNSVHNVIKLIIRISHTEPGKRIVQEIERRSEQRNQSGCRRTG